MVLMPDYQPEFESLKARLLELAQYRDGAGLMRRVVELLAERPHVALARIWLKGGGDLCATCRMASGCRNRRECLHLVSSAGQRQGPDRPDWSKTEGDYQRIPLGTGKIGRVGATGEAIVVRDLEQVAGWHARYEWAAREKVRGFNAQPIKFKDDVLGVITIFTYIPTPEEGPLWMRIFADQIAAGLINARAFQEIERLRSQLEAENTYLREEVREARALGEIIGDHPSIRELMRQIEIVAPTNVTVLILGESGTGKELVARELHRLSRRSDRPLIRVNCASVPRELYESEFFGHVRGAFTGAMKDRAGRFEAADGGTLLLDEVGEIPDTLQSKFLRVLQEKQYERVGEEKTRSVDVRILAATNRNLKKEVEAGRFRQDLFYRLNVFPLVVPPLRERIQDVERLTHHFLRQASARLHVPVPALSESQLRLLRSYAWPGNVRELQNATERALILAQHGVLKFDLPVADLATLAPANGPGTKGGTLLTEVEVRALQKQSVHTALARSAGRIHGPGGAAELLGLRPTTLISRMKRMGIRRTS